MWAWPVSYTHLDVYKRQVRNAACAESDGFNAASIDVAFVDDGRIQVASHIDRTSRDQVKAC